MRSREDASGAAEHSASVREALDRRTFCVQAVKTTTWAALLYAVGGCSCPPPDRPEQKRTADVRSESVSLDSLRADEDLMGRKCMLHTVLSDGLEADIDFEFRNVSTLIIDGDTHTLQSIDVGNQTMTLRDTVPVIDVKAEELIERIVRDESDGSIVLESSFGKVRIAREDFDAMILALAHPKQGDEAEQSIHVPIRTEMSCSTRIALETAVMTGMTDRSALALPSSCAVHVESVRSQRIAAAKR